MTHLRGSATGWHQVQYSCIFVYTQVVKLSVGLQPSLAAEETEGTVAWIPMACFTYYHQSGVIIHY